MSLNSDDTPDYDEEGIPTFDEEGTVSPPKRGVGRPLGSKTNPAKKAAQKKKKQKQAERAAVEGAPPPPPRSRKKPTVPKEVLRAMALFPLNLASKVQTIRTGGEMGLAFSEDATLAVQEAFEEWLGTAEVELTPGWALIGAYAMAIATSRPIDLKAAATHQPRPERDVTPTATTEGQSPDGTRTAA